MKKLLKVKLTQMLALTRRAPVYQRGMSLIEVMVVLVIIGLIGSVITVSVFGQLSKARKETALNQIREISKALELYQMSYRGYPSTAEGLGVLVAPKGNEKPILPSMPTDPWGHEFVYIFPGTHNAGGFDLFSNGEDGVGGSADDIGNWQSTATP